MRAKLIAFEGMYGGDKWDQYYKSRLVRTSYQSFSFTIVIRYKRKTDQ
jgi:hypothetical protein